MSAYEDFLKSARETVGSAVNATENRLGQVADDVANSRVGRFTERAVVATERKVGEVAHDVADSQVGRFTEHAVVGAYNFVIGDDIKTLRDPNASVLDKTIAGISIASNFVGPEGKVFGRGLSILTKVGEHALERGGAELAMKELEKVVGKDGLKAFDKAMVDAGKWVSKHAPEIEKAITKAAEITGAIKSVEGAPAQIKKTVDDIERCFQPGASTWDRVKAAGEVAKDVYGLYGDYKSIKKGIADVRNAPTPTVNAARTEELKLHPDDGVRRKLESGHDVVETDRAIFDARGGKTMRDKSIAELGELAKHDGKPVIVIGHDLDHATQKKLAEEGILVAKDAKAAKTLETTLRLPGAERAQLLKQQLQNTDVYVAYEQRKHVDGVRDFVEGARTNAIDAVNTAREVAVDAARRVNDARIGVGHRHDDALPYDGKAHTGTVTYTEDGRIEQYIGQNKYMTYTEAQLNNQVPNVGDRMEVQPGGNVTIQRPHAVEQTR